MHWQQGKLQLQPSAVITRSNLSRYYIRHCDNSGRKWIRYLNHSRHPMLWGVYCEDLGKKIDRVITASHCMNKLLHMLDASSEPWAHFLSLARSRLRLCSANHRAGYLSNLACDWLSIVWAYSEQETESGPGSQSPSGSSTINFVDRPKQCLYRDITRNNLRPWISRHLISIASRMTAVPPMR